MSAGIDWSATGAMLSGLGTVFGSFAVVFAAVVGRQVVEDFRKQKIAANENEYGEKILTIAYRLQDAVSVMRSPMSMGFELGESEKALEEAGTLKGVDFSRRQKLIQANVFFLRAAHYDDLWKEGYEIAPLLKAYFGTEAATKFAEIMKVRHSVRVFANAYSTNEERDPKFARKIESVIWEGANVDGVDEIAKTLAENLTYLENLILPKLRPDRSLRVS